MLKKIFATAELRKYVQHDEVRTEFGFENKFNNKKDLLLIDGKYCLKVALILGFECKQKVPYRTIFPDAPEREWKLRNTDCEKKIKVVRLKDLDVDPEDLFRVDEICPDDDSIDSEEEESTGSSGILISTTQQHHNSIAYQAYQCVEAAGPDGLKQKELGDQLGLSQLDARSALRILKRLDVVDCIVKDVKKNRVFV